ncbi:transcriptional regulation of mitochondrial recombination-domain-containing protein [Xylogone sp. PMI_703]|nr:transcriptional regulation of mitochondrial recombination-domain-containing protein [Xylogone sp. PMI_703]
MNSRPVIEQARLLVCTARQIRAASTSSSAKTEHGREIFVFNNILTNQVVYSLTKAPKNNAALSQIPYNGKKTRPPALRKDHWMPLCTITFPEGAAFTSTPPPTSHKARKLRPSSTPLSTQTPVGLLAFQKLREYRKLHETAWEPTSNVAVTEDGKFLNRKVRQRKLCDQKANSVADMAAVLAEVGSLAQEKGVLGQEQPIEVRWSNLLDAEFAESWSPLVVHDTLTWDINNREKDKMTPFRRKSQEYKERLAEGELENVA